MNDTPERIELSVIHGSNIANVVCPICEVVVERRAFGVMHRWKCASCGRSVVDRDTPKGECPRCHVVNYDLDELDVKVRDRVALPQPCTCCGMAPLLLERVFGQQEGVVGVFRLIDQNDQPLAFMGFTPKKNMYKPPQGDVFNATIFLQHNMVIRARHREGAPPEFLMVVNPGMTNVFVRVSRDSDDGSVVLTKVRGTNDGNVIAEDV